MSVVDQGVNFAVLAGSVNAALGQLVPYLVMVLGLSGSVGIVSATVRALTKVGR